MINSFIKKRFNPRIKQLQHIAEHATEIQYNLFQYLISKANKTVFGKEHHFSSIRSYEDFERQVPVRTYEQFYPYIEQVLLGERKILWNTPTSWFAKSSGTTNDKSKFIPITKESLKSHFLAGGDAVAFYLSENPQSKLFDPKALALVLGGSQKVINSKNGKSKHSIGDISAIIVKNMPFWSKFFRTPNEDIMLMEDYEAKIEAMANTIMKQNITSIYGVPTWVYVLIKRVLELTNQKTVDEIWPNLELFVHGAVNFDPYRKIFKEVITKSDMHYVETYNASEGFFASQSHLNSSDLTLFLQHGIFYEFIPIEHIDDENPKAIPISKVEKDKVYAMVISTVGGLWRYSIGDTVKFTSIQPYKIRIQGRTKHFINAFGEELMIENAEKALQITCTAFNTSIKEFTACPIYLSSNKKGAHQWLIEFNKNPDNIELFAEKLDENIRKINTDYDAKRSADLALEMLRITAVPPNTFFKWMKKRNKLGGQNKVPRLSNDRQFVEDILALIHS